MTDENNDANAVDLDAVARDIDAAIDVSAQAAADSVETALEEAAQDAPAAEAAEPTADVDDILNEAMAGLDASAVPAEAHDQACLAQLRNVLPTPDRFHGRAWPQGRFGPRAGMEGDSR